METGGEDGPTGNLGNTRATLGMPIWRRMTRAHLDGQSVICSGGWWCHGSATYRYQHERLPRGKRGENSATVSVELPSRGQISQRGSQTTPLSGSIIAETRATEILARGKDRNQVASQVEGHCPRREGAVPARWGAHVRLGAQCMRITVGLANHQDIHYPSQFVHHPPPSVQTTVYSGYLHPSQLATSGSSQPLLTTKPRSAAWPSATREASLIGVEPQHRPDCHHRPQFASLIGLEPARRWSLSRDTRVAARWPLPRSLAKHPAACCQCYPN